VKKYRLHKANAIRFRRWSRKAYAVFASLGKSITIGSLSVHMAGDTLFRKVQLIKSIIITGEQEKELSPEEEPALLLTESTLIVNFVSKTAGEYPAAYNQYLYHLS
jgi:hypothetical protein